MATAKKLGEVCWLHPESKGEGPTPRSGHSISCIDGKAIVFGGCGVSADGLSQEIYNDTWELHIGEGDSPSWHLADAMGDLPNPRWRHTATVLPDSGGILLFGGLCKGQRFNDTFVYSMSQKEWNIKECGGAAPHPRSHHTANMVELPGGDEDDPDALKHKVAVVGGYGGPGTTRDFFMDVHLLQACDLPRSPPALPMCACI